jgi:L-amino acid N-acyltransferase YncA
MIKNLEIEDALREKLSEISDLISAMSCGPISFSQLDKGVTRLEELIFSMDEINQKKCDEFFRSIPIQTQQRLINNYCDWETEIETEYAELLGEGVENTYTAYRLYPRFLRLLTKELQLVKDYQFSNILFIGSGPFPITAILLHVLTKQKIECLEKDETSASISRRALARLNLQDKVIVHVGDGVTFDMSKYDLILNALLAKPKWEIVRNIRRSAKSTCLLLCRTSFGLRRLLYEETPLHAIKGHRMAVVQRAGFDDTISTWLLIRNEKTIEELEFEWLDSLDKTRLEKLVALQHQIILTDDNNGFVKQRTADDYFYQQLVNDVNSGLRKILIVRDKERYYGQLILQRYHHDSYAHRVEVMSLMMEKSIRGRRVSLRVAEELIRKCEELDVSTITIDVRAGSKPESLWRYLGFIEYGFLPVYSQINGNKFGGVYMYQQVSVLKSSILQRLGILFDTRKEQATVVQ